MMALDQNLSSLFAEQKLHIQARQELKNKVQKEKKLRRDFQIRVSVQVTAGHPELLLPSLCSCMGSFPVLWPQVLDLIEVLVTKQPEHPLGLELLEPLLSIIQHNMRSKGSSKQEQDLLHKTARIFM